MARTNMMAMHEIGKSMAEASNSPQDMLKFRKQARDNKGPLKGFSEEEIDELMLSYNKFRPRAEK